MMASLGSDLPKNGSNASRSHKETQTSHVTVGEGDDGAGLLRASVALGGGGAAGTSAMRIPPQWRNVLRKSGGQKIGTAPRMPLPVTNYE